MRSNSVETFTAFLQLPPNFNARPVLEEAVNEGDGGGPNPCLISETNVEGIFALDLGSLGECGVRSCTEQGEDWLCLLLRFPVMTGLKLPEDEVIDIKCKPQDRLVEGRNVINFQKNS